MYYEEIEIHHIGTRDVRTFVERDEDIGIPKPRVFPMKTLSECIECAQSLGYDEEGYVVVDRYYNRVKIKSPTYVALHHMSQGTTTHSNIVEIIQANKQDEFLLYFPEFSEIFETIIKRIENFSVKLDSATTRIRDCELNSRKELAEIIKKTECPACVFALFDRKAPNARSWLLSRPVAKVLSYLGISPENTVNFNDTMCSEKVKNESDDNE